MRCSTHTSVHQPPTEVLRTLFVKLSWMCWHGRILEEAPGNYPLGGSESRNRSMPHLYTWRHRYIYFEPSLARLDPLYAVITESHTEIQEKLSHVPVGLRAYSYLFWLTDSNTKVYGLHALMFTTETTAIIGYIVVARRVPSSWLLSCHSCITRHIKWRLNSVRRPLRRHQKFTLSTYLLQLLGGRSVMTKFLLKYFFESGSLTNQHGKDYHKGMMLSPHASPSKSTWTVYL